MTKVRIVGIVGARPNFMKMAPVARLLQRHSRFSFSLIHTGQHYSSMSDPFFRDLDLSKPDFHLKVGSGASQAQQIGVIVTRVAKVLQKIRPALVLVVGDVNSTLAGALAAHKMGIGVGHIEAGLRSFDESMPEETNRRLTDLISNFCFTHSPEADVNLRREGVSQTRIFRVGNLMIDSVLALRERAQKSRILERLDLSPGGYALLTLHRPSNVDQEADLRRFADLLDEIASLTPLVFPVHPRTRKNALRFGIWKHAPPNGIRLIEPLGYLDFLKLESEARLVLTDSGGIQEETTVLGVPCLTLRDNTERPVTLSHGTNRLVGTRSSTILRHVRSILSGPRQRGRVPALWDGKAAYRLVGILEKAFLRPNR